MATEPSASRSKRSSSTTDPEHAPRHKKRQNLDDYDEEEAITKEEIEGTESPPPPPPSSSHGKIASPQAPSRSKPRNAFSELMSSKPKPSQTTTTTTIATSSSTTSSSQKPKKSDSFRDNLGIYLTNLSSPQIIFHTDSFVAIHDFYPKATVHTLLLPRSPSFNRLHPFDALADPVFLASARTEATRLQVLVAKELQRRLGRFSTRDAKRNAILDGVGVGVEEEEAAQDAAGNLVLPGPGSSGGGRDWARDTKVGVHAVPSMNHLHIHVLSRDMHSEKMKHRKHYNSFTTDFFVDLDQFPLEQGDWRWEKGAQRNWPDRNMVCWRCGRDFGNRFKELKEHLEEEFEEWKRE